MIKRTPQTNLKLFSKITFETNNYRGQIFRSCFQARIKPANHLNNQDRLLLTINRKVEKLYWSNSNNSSRIHFYFIFFNTTCQKKKKKLRKKTNNREKRGFEYVSVYFSLMHEMDFDVIDCMIGCCFCLVREYFTQTETSSLYR